LVTGTNRVYVHEGREFHIQIEDLGQGDTIEVRVYDTGAVLFVKRVPYSEAIAGAPERDDAIRAFMEKTIQTVSAAIAKGKIT
jgi:predicted aspartyl protease